MIKVYTKSSCMPCKMTKKYLKDNHIDFLEIDVEANPYYLDYLGSLGMQSLPVVEASGFEPFFGFRPERLKDIAEEQK